MGTKIADLFFAWRLRPWLSVALAVMFLAAPPGLFAERQGATLRLDLLDGRRLQGELLAVKGEALLLLGDSGSEAQAAIGEVAELRIVRGNRVGKGLVAGLVTGFVVGCLAGLPYALGDDEGYGLLIMGIAGSAFGGAGAIVGAGAGLIASSDEIIRCRDRNEAWRSAVLNRLRRLAHFRDFAGAAPGNGPGGERPPVAASDRVPAQPRQEEFARWRLGATIVQLPRPFERRAQDFSLNLQYLNPVSAAGRGSSRTYDEGGIGRWVRLSDIRLEYFLTRRWAIGVLLDPFARETRVYGDKPLHIAGQELKAWWDMEISSHSYFLTAAYSLVAADGFLRQTALRLRAGLGWNRSGFDYNESASAWSYYGDPEPDIISYSASANNMRPTSSLSALVEGEAAQYVNSRWSLALNAGFRYLPLRVRDQEMPGTITRRPPLNALGCSVTIPGTTLNLGGFYLGVTLGFHL